jgi:ABC-type branched-subunit amino acid transport system ATPase component
LIQIESVKIQELRGIRDLTLTMNRGSLVISGPNGSGKSGVVDAIQFALTGEIGRLKGAGTGDLSLSDHGPHVEKRSDLDAASVSLNVYIPTLRKRMFDGLRGISTAERNGRLSNGERVPKWIPGMKIIRKFSRGFLSSGKVASPRKSESNSGQRVSGAVAPSASARVGLSRRSIKCDWQQV